MSCSLVSKTELGQERTSRAKRESIDKGQQVFQNIYILFLLLRKENKRNVKEIFTSFPRLIKVV